MNVFRDVLAYRDLMNTTVYTRAAILCLQSLTQDQEEHSEYR